VIFHCIEFCIERRKSAKPRSCTEYSIGRWRRHYPHSWVSSPLFGSLPMPGPVAEFIPWVQIETVYTLPDINVQLPGSLKPQEAILSAVLSCHPWIEKHPEQRSSFAIFPGTAPREHNRILKTVSNGDCPYNISILHIVFNRKRNLVWTQGPSFTDPDRICYSFLVTREKICEGPLLHQISRDICFLLVPLAPTTIIFTSILS